MGLLSRMPALGGAISKAALLGILVTALGACGLPKPEATSMADVDADSVLIVGAIEIVPPLNANERDVDMPNDLFNASASVENRAVLWAADDPWAERSAFGFAINPELEGLYFFTVPRSLPYLVDGQITTSMRGFIERRILLPSPMHVDMRRRDRAIYVGTLRLARDDFNEVTSVEVLDDYRKASGEFEQRFGDGVELRRALLQIPGR